MRNRRPSETLPVPSLHGGDGRDRAFDKSAPEGGCRGGFLLLFSLLLLGLLNPLPARAQLFKYLDVTDGLSDKRVLSIKKDRTGYVWLLTYTGIDRFDGKDFRHYRLSSEQGFVALYSEDNILRTTSDGRVWVATPGGHLSVYDPLADDFTEVTMPAELLQGKLCTLVEMTDDDRVWFCYEGGYACVFDCRQHTFSRISLPAETCGDVSAICRTGKDAYMVGAEKGVFRATMRNDSLAMAGNVFSEYRFRQTERIYLHEANGRVVLCCAKDGVVVYDPGKRAVERTLTELADLPVTDICPFDDGRILIATRGAGVFIYDFRTREISQQFYKDTNELNRMNGNNVRSVFLDENRRLWMAVYPIGVTVYDKHYPAFRWYRHHVGNGASISNNQVNCVLEDADGDIWYATNNGISIYRSRQKAWQHLLTQEQHTGGWQKGHTFQSLCETGPGVVLAGGYMTGLCRIDKNSGKTELLQPGTFTDGAEFHLPNRFIRVICQDDDGFVWTGGNNYLGCTDVKTGETYSYPVSSPVTCMLQADSATLLVGTGDGLFRLDKRERVLTRMFMPFSSQHINTIYRHTDGNLYIGTTNSGLVVLCADGTYRIYTYKVSALLNDVVNTILPLNDNQLILTTEQSITIFDIAKDLFYNWTEDQGLINASFNPRAGIHTSRGTFIFGSNDGAVELADTVQFPRYDYTKVMIDRILVDNRRPVLRLTERGKAADWNMTGKLHLEHDQNSVSFHVTGINYGNPRHTYFQWKLCGEQDFWTTGRTDGWIHFHDLKPGHYVLWVQNVAQEDYSIIGERVLDIIIRPSFWQTGWAMLLYLSAVSVAVSFLVRFFRQRAGLLRAEARIRQFGRIWHGLKVSLLIARASVREVLEQEGDALGAKSRRYLQQTLSGVENFYFTHRHLPQGGSTGVSGKVRVVSSELNGFMAALVRQVAPLAEERHVVLDYLPLTSPCTVWIDRQLCEVLFGSLLANMIRQTPPGRTLRLALSCTDRSWTALCTNSADVGEETSGWKKRRSHRRPSDDSLLFIRDNVRLHKGKLSCEFVGHTLSRVSISLPADHPAYFRVPVGPSLHQPEAGLPAFGPHWLPAVALSGGKGDESDSHPKRGHLLLVSDDRAVLDFLDNAFCDEWHISLARSISLALELVTESVPDLILAGGLMPDGHVDTLCSLLKADVSTGHIPLILFTSAEESARAFAQGRVRADYYIDRLFDVPQIRQMLRSVLDSRQRLDAHWPGQTATAGSKSVQMAKAAGREHDQMFLHRVYEVARAHAEDGSFDVDALCRRLGMSRTSLYNRLKGLTSQAPGDIIREVRMQHAAGLLLASSCTISEVSDRMGFGEPKYFREVFRKYYGMTPSEYIKQNEKKSATSDEQRATS